MFKKYCFSILSVIISYLSYLFKNIFSQYSFLKNYFILDLCVPKYIFSQFSLVFLYLEKKNFILDKLICSKKYGFSIFPCNFQSGKKDYFILVIFILEYCLATFPCITQSGKKIISYLSYLFRIYCSSTEKRSFHTCHICLEYIVPVQKKDHFILVIFV